MSTADSIIISPFANHRAKKLAREAQESDETTLRRCKGACGLEKPLVEFYRLSGKRCRMHKCIVCYNAECTARQRVQRRIPGRVKAVRNMKVEQALARIGIGQTLEYASRQVGVDPELVRAHMEAT